MSIRVQKGRTSSLASFSKSEKTDGEGQQPSQGSRDKPENSILVHFYSVMWIRASLRVSEFLVSRRLCTWRQMPFPTCWGTRKAQQEVEEWWCERTSCCVEGLHTIGLCISRFPSETMHAKRTWNDGMKTLRQIFQRYLALKSEFGRMGQREVWSKSVRFMS